MILLGGAFAIVYWVMDSAVTILPMVPQSVLFGAGVVMVIAWSVAAGYLAARTLRNRSDLLRGTIEHILLWVAMFGGATILTTWSAGALLALFWDRALETMFWFGMLTVSSIFGGILAIGLSGAYAGLSDSNRDVR